MVKNPKNKGSAFERQTGRDLSLWLTNGESKTQVIRSVLSGGWSEQDGRQLGDLQANGEEGERFFNVAAVECKHYKGIDFWKLFSSDNPEIMQWWGKHAAECFEYQKHPFLIMKQNYYPTLIGMREEVCRAFVDLFDEPFVACGNLGSHLESVIFVQFDRFLDLVDPKDFFKELENG